MIILSILLFVLIALVVWFWFLRSYIIIRRTPLYIVTAAFVAFFIPSSIIALVPIDVTPSVFSLPHGALLAIWRVLYWLSFFLTWAILPILQSYVESGHRNPRKRFLEALRVNARYQVMILIAGALALVYYALTVRLSFSHFKSLLIALSHSYTLFIAIYLLGHGLVNVPRRLYTGASHQKTLVHLERTAPRIHDSLVDANSHVIDLAKEVSALNQVKEEPFREWVDEMMEMVPNVPSPRRGNPAELNEENLASLTRKIKYMCRKRDRLLAQWNALLVVAQERREVISSKGKLQHWLLPERLAYQYKYRVWPAVNYGLAGALIIASACVLISELAHNKFSILELSVNSASAFLKQLLVALWLAYMCICAYASLLRIKVFNVGLVHRKTDAGSLVIFGSYLCRLTVPLSFNYLTLLRNQQSVFHEFLGRSINLTTLGAGWNEWLPVLIIIPVMATSFNLYEKVGNWAGYGIWDEEDEEGSWIEGRDLVSKALRERAAGNYATVSTAEVPAENEEGALWGSIKGRFQGLGRPKWMQTGGWIGLQDNDDEFPV